MAEVQTGGMIALIPDDPGRFTVRGGDPVGEMHCTLAFLGDDVSALDDETRAELVERVAALAQRFGKITMRVQGVGIWNRDGGPTGDMRPSTNTLLQLDPTATSLRESADMAGRDALGARYPDQFHPWAPHICAGYDLDPTALPKADGEVTFSKIRLALAGDDQDFPLTGSNAMDVAPGYAAEGVTTMADTKTPAPTVEAGTPREDGTVPVFFPCLAVEGVETSDGRYIEPGALGVRTPPLSVFAQTQNTGKGGHSGAVVVGNLTEAWKIPGPEFVSRQTGEALPEGTFVWQGRGEVDGNSEGGQLFVKKYLRGNSIDLSEADYADEITYNEDDTEHHRVTVTKGMIGATTLCAIPAFPDAYGEIEGEEGGYSAPVEALGDGYDKTIEGLADFLRDQGFEPVTASVAIAELGDACSECLASAAEELGTLPPALAKKAAAKKAAAKGDTDDDADEGPDGDADDGKPDFLKKGKAKSRTAAAPLLPPLEYFTDPGLSGPTPLTIEGDRIFGHIATWGTCHIGISKKCTPPPRSASDYAYFNVGAKRVADNGTVRTVGVGHLTMNTGHAELSASADATVSHYDHTGTVAADVAAGEDAHGIWINGLIRPELSAADRDKLAAAPPSGDWRGVNGHLEMVGVLAVNVPGYPVVRARVASGQPEPVALVAAGATRPASAFGPGGLDLDALADRIVTRLEARLAPREQDREATAEEQAALSLELEQLEALEGMRPFSATATPKGTH